MFADLLKPFRQTPRAIRLHVVSPDEPVISSALTTAIPGTLSLYEDPHIFVEQLRNHLRLDKYILSTFRVPRYVWSFLSYGTGPPSNFTLIRMVVLLLGEVCAKWQIVDISFRMCSQPRQFSMARQRYDT